MADQHSHGEGHGNLFRTYMIVAVALAIATAMSFLVNQTIDSKAAAFVLILSVAIIKATLVGTYFMHLKWDWRLLYFLIIPAFILGTMMMIVLMPDSVIGPAHDAGELMGGSPENN